MSTHMHAHVASQVGRWSEVDELISQVELLQSGPRFDAIARATIVMISAHFEGSLKDTAKAFLADLNTSSQFQHAPSTTKQHYCRVFTGVAADSREGLDRQQRLVSLFDSLNPKFEYDPFIGGTANPKPDVITRICANLGERNVFGSLHASRIDDVFSGDARVAAAILTELETALLSGLSIYPYTVTRSQFNLGKSPKKGTLWEDFVNNMLMKRHQIAHGSSLTNSSSPQELRETKTKSLTLIYSLIYALCAS